MADDEVWDMFVSVTVALMSKPPRLLTVMEEG